MPYLALLGILILSLSLGQDSSPTGDQAPLDSQPSEQASEETSAKASQEEPKKPLSGITIKRKDRTIKVLQYAPADKGAISRLSIPGCEKDLKLNVFYAPESYPFVETLVNETIITSRIAIHRQPPKEQGGGDKAKLELFGGTLTTDEETHCPDKVVRTEQTDVTLKQGRTTITGKTFNYDNYNVDTDQKILTGNVKIESQDRVSEADKLEYDEKNSIAVLYGNPAKSTKGEDVLQGKVIVYYLDSNDVVLKGDIQGTVTVNLGTTTTPADPTPPEDPTAGDGQ
jgi:hypothetical protein